MSVHNLVIIGSGPSGYTAAIYAARAQLAPVLYAGYQSGGQLMWTSDVENFPGFPKGINGPELMFQMRDQAEKFGTQIFDEHVTAVDFSSRPFKVWTGLPEGVSFDDWQNADQNRRQEIRRQLKEQEPTLTAKAVIISTGASSIMLGVPGEQELLGKGVSTCAVCDAAFYKEKDTFVVGGGDSAMEDTLALTKFAKSVTVIHRRDSFRASKIMQDRVLKHPKVKVLWNSQITKVEGSQEVTGIVVDSPEGQQSLPADGVFIAIGHKPASDVFRGQVELDDQGYVVTQQSASKYGVAAAQKGLNHEGLLPFPSLTSVEGVFAGGDIVDVRYRQAVTAAAQGCAAALDAERWLEGQN